MSPERFSTIGKTIFGPSWRGAMARRLDVAERTVRRWQDGDNDIPEGVGRDLAAICRAQSTILNQIADELEKGR